MSTTMLPFPNYSSIENSRSLLHNPSNWDCQIYRELPNRAELLSSTQVCFSVYHCCYVFVVVTYFLHKTEVSRKRLDNSHHISFSSTYLMCQIFNSMHSPMVINKEGTYILSNPRLRSWFIYCLLFFQSLMLTISPTKAIVQESLNGSTILERTLRSTKDFNRILKVDSHYLSITDGHQEFFATIHENGELELSYKPKGELSFEY